MPEHTPTPWRVANGIDVRSEAIGFLAYVSTAGARGRTLDEARANAALIVRAVNANADLLAALEAIDQYAYDHLASWLEGRHIRDLARAAIARAKQ